MKRLRRTTTRRASGFTLVEVAVTIVIVGMTLVASLQVLQGAKLTAAQTRNEKLAREMAMYTLGRIESGLYWEDVSDLRIDGTYADEGHPELNFEVVMGDETFRERDTFGNVSFDNWRQRAADKKAKEDGDAEDEEMPYEKVQIKVIFPKLADFKNELVLEKWMEWRRVHPEEGALNAGKSTDGKADVPPEAGAKNP
ncbi:MAG TPA: type II secretion system protein [Planctomycetota bacterium]|nr:type II secretion system protein [Planctomycetota bacterium]